MVYIVTMFIFNGIVAFSALRLNFNKALNLSETKLF